MYQPLPDCLTIKESKLHGLGLFATEDIPVNTVLGMTHLKYNADIIRTPLGGFYNHSDTPNCMKLMNKNQFKTWWDLYTWEEIKAGDEITVAYTFYKV